MAYRRRRVRFRRRRRMFGRSAYRSRFGRRFKFRGKKLSRRFIARPRRVGRRL